MAISERRQRERQIDGGQKASNARLWGQRSNPARGVSAKPVCDSTAPEKATEKKAAPIRVHLVPPWCVLVATSAGFYECQAVSLTEVPLPSMPKDFVREFEELWIEARNTGLAQRLAFVDPGQFFCTAAFKGMVRKYIDRHPATLMVDVQPVTTRA